MPGEWSWVITTVENLGWDRKFWPLVFVDESSLQSGEHSGLWLGERSTDGWKPHPGLWKHFMSIIRHE